MKFDLKKILGKGQIEIIEIADFWQWFNLHEKAFFQSIKAHEIVADNVLTPISSQLSKLYEGIYLLTGMQNGETAEIILSPEGDVKLFAIVEQIIEEAPDVQGWTFTALKPAIRNIDFEINAYGQAFNLQNTFFKPFVSTNYPDNVNLIFSHEHITEENQNQIGNGIFILLDNYLGELEAATLIDNVEIAPYTEADEEWIPLAKIDDYLRWREKEFVEKYGAVRHDPTDDQFVSLEALTEENKPVIAIIDRTLLEWDRSMSHPWITVISFHFDGSMNHGFPDEITYKHLNDLEEEIIHQLPAKSGYLNLGRQTVNDVREVYFACIEYRKPSIVLHSIKYNYSGEFKIEFDIFKDKYWCFMDRFRA